MLASSIQRYSVLLLLCAAGPKFSSASPEVNAHRSLQALTVTFDSSGRPPSPLPLCHGDCDDDSQCAGDLTCFQRNGLEAVPGCEGAGQSGYDYCIEGRATENTFLVNGNNGVPAEHFPLGLCEGDCDNDGECGLGLFCQQRAADEPVPGCIGTARTNYDYCRYPDADQLFISFPVGSGEPPAPLAACRGDCDNDDQCEGDLVCFERISSSNPVPGCTGSAPSGVAFCAERPTVNTAWTKGNDGAPEANFPLGFCEADCDNDSECGPGLVCEQRSANEVIPGCIGAPISGYDYCRYPIVPADAECPRTIDLGATCDLATLTAALSASGTTCTVEKLFPGQDATSIAASVEELCEYDAPTQFVEIQGTYQRDHNYMDGGGSLSDGEYNFEMDSARLNRFIANSMDDSYISWPEYEQKESYNAANGYGNNGYMTNFNIDKDAEKGSCDMNTAMCCFTESKKDALPDNADVCRHDLSTSPQSNHVASGWSVFTSDETAYCVGFTWEDDTVSDLYKGNALFYSSLYQTATKGYTSNVPGAPMCACVEQMPVVTKAACVTASGTGLDYKIELDSHGVVSATSSASITYGDCGTDLKSHVKTVHAGTNIETDIDAYLVGENNCDITNSDYLNEEQLLVTTATDKFTDLDGANYEGKTWKQLFGEGIFFLPPILDRAESDAEMRAALEACIPSLGRYCMLLRKCPSCTSEDHQIIVYQRLTEFPPYAQGPSTSTTMDIPELFMNKWRKPNNVMHTDYELYSSVADALAGDNEWQVSDYNNNNNNYGFPRNSGPHSHVGNQWNSYKWGGAYANQHGFYVEVP